MSREEECECTIWVCVRYGAVLLIEDYILLSM